MLKNYIDIPNELWRGIYQTGSSVICSPPVLDTDIDFVICTTSYGKLYNFLKDHEFQRSCVEEEEYDLESEEFECYRKGNINFIVTEDYEWYKKWVFATKVAKKLNLLKKEDRITLFKAILYSEI
jgi:hypothetical protein